LPKQKRQKLYDETSLHRRRGRIGGESSSDFQEKISGKTKVRLIFGFGLPFLQYFYEVFSEFIDFTVLRV
jgi:hypothetical protein